MEYSEITITESPCESVEIQSRVLETEKTETGYNSVVDQKERDHELLRTTIENLPKFDVQIGQQHPLSILLAEDSLVNLKITLWFLKKLGYRADVAFTGIEAVDALKRQPYDVILMDAEMPEMDGRDATIAIRKDFPADQQPHIIAMTANASQGDRESFLSIGMNDYITKPLNLDEVVRALLACHPTHAAVERIAAENSTQERTLSRVA
jgi:CheY-like chemotaxis protein